jgi:hypothetical protein
MITRPTLSALAAFLAACLWMLTSATTASATQNPDPGYPIPPGPTVVTKVIREGTPLWVFALVAIVSMCLAIAATLAWRSVRAYRTERPRIGRSTTSGGCAGGVRSSADAGTERARRERSERL